ncbi:MAG: cytochrome c4 [Proteobacteria bacterium]|nr:cytochrome c4 [Pseudomonadota bacterium]
MKFFIRAAVSILAVISLQALAEGDAAAGQVKSAICGACHGADGNSVVPNWPKLAGQHADYLVRQFTLIKSGARTVPEMVGIVASMSDQDSRDIAAWFSSQTNNGGVADPSVVALGQRIYQAGNVDSGVPACMSCHGPAGEGNPLAGYPALAGQHAMYTSKMLTGFRAGDHWGDDDRPSVVMSGAAARLGSEEIEAVASYIQGLYLDLE